MKDINWEELEREEKIRVFDDAQDEFNLFWAPVAMELSKRGSINAMAFKGYLRQIYNLTKEI